MLFWVILLEYNAMKNDLSQTIFNFLTAEEKESNKIKVGKAIRDPVSGRDAPMIIHT